MEARTGSRTHPDRTPELSAPGERGSARGDNAGGKWQVAAGLRAGARGIQSCSRLPPQWQTVASARSTFAHQLRPARGKMCSALGGTQHARSRIAAACCSIGR